ncbi:MAG: phytanoyl-CoA dioxygenase family protein [Armatimonadetes bacterium]|nr:phytanoyl-CoA dioxygenase family protein [Armatimonadota bacterium]
MKERERYLFDLQGFLLVEDALSPQRVAALNGLLDEQIARRAEADMRTQRFGGPVSWGEHGRALVDNPRLAPYLTELLGPNHRLDHDYADVIRSGLGPIGATLHGGATPFDPAQYFLFRDGRMHNGLTVVAYNLKDVHPGDGGFGCVPGSHKSNYPYPDEWRNLENPPPFVQAVTGPAGSAVIFTEALTHGTMPWRGLGERRTLFLKYCPRPVAWSRRGYPAEDPALTGSQRRILASPGVYPPPDQEDARK